MKIKKKKEKKILLRMPLPRQTGGAHKPAKGGKWDRNRFRRETRAELDSMRREIEENR